MNLKGENVKRLTNSEKLQMCELDHEKMLHAEIHANYGIGRSTVTGSVSKDNEIKRTVNQLSGNCLNSNKKSPKTFSYPELDAALFQGVRQIRENIPVIGPMMTKKAQQFFPMLYPNISFNFTASAGYILNFCKRHVLNNVSIQEEKSSADHACSLAFINTFPQSVASYSQDQF